MDLTNNNNADLSPIEDAVAAVSNNTGESYASLSEVGWHTRSHPAEIGHPERRQHEACSAPEAMPKEFFMEMIKMMQSMSRRIATQSQERTKITDIFLPSYDPDGNVGVREWCDHISTAVTLYQLSDYDVRMKVSSLLKGRAKIWADEWLVTTSTWDELRQIILTTFEPEHRFSRDVLMFREHIYDSSKDLSEFLSKAWMLWKRVTKDKLDNADAVEAVIGSISDQRLRIELTNARATSVPELISVASSIRPKRVSPSTAYNSTQPPNKRARLEHKQIPFCTY